jgi:hypothetical protein
MQILGERTLAKAAGQSEGQTVEVTRKRNVGTDWLSVVTLP